MLTPEQIARGLLTLAVVALSGCSESRCVDGKLYLWRGGDVYVRDEWDRTCINGADIDRRAELERIADE